MADFSIKKTTSENLLIPVGGRLDILTGSFRKGVKGEMILVGGLDSVYVITGPGNSYKSTLLHHFTLTALDHMYLGSMKKLEKPVINTYDTETNVKFERVNNFLQKKDNLPKCMLSPDCETGNWRILTKADCFANEWVMDFNDYNKQREKEKKVTFTAFIDPYTNQPYKAHFPVMHQTDSITEFDPASSIDMLDKAKDGESGTETFYLKSGLFKSKFISSLPTVTRKTNSYFGYVAHTGENKNIGGNKYNKPEKQNQYLKGDMEIKGATGKNNYLTLLSLFAHTATSLKNPVTKLPEFPRGNAVEDYETDLNIVKLTLLRSKSGPSGTVIEYVVSQTDGVLIPLTDFWYIKVKEKNFGISGTNLSYWVDLYPDVKLRKGTVRDLLETDKLLAKAVYYTAHLKDLMKYHPGYSNLLMQPKELYEAIVKEGYEWKTLLKARSVWTIDQYTKDEFPYLSILDLLEMAKGFKIPYWLEKDKKTVKKEWKHHFEDKKESKGD